MLIDSVKTKLLQAGIRSTSKLSPALSSRLFWRLFCTPTVASRPTPSQSQQLSQAERFQIPFGHKTLNAYKWEGEGPVILAVHGWGGRAHVFGDLVPELSKRFTVVSFDAPGHNRLGERTHMLEYSSAIRAVTRTVGPVEGLVGHSFGAFTSAYTASKLPNLKALALIGAPDRLEYILDYAQRAMWAPDHIRQRLEERIEKLSGEPVADHATSKYLQQVEAPTLFIHDHDDREVPVKRAKDMAAATYSELLLTQGFGHHRVLSSNDVATGLGEFFDRHLV